MTFNYDELWREKRVLREASKDDWWWLENSLKLVENGACMYVK